MLYFALVLFILWLLLMRRCLAIIIVYGRSMEPTLFAGDRVLRLWTRRLLRQGQCSAAAVAGPSLRFYRLQANKYNGRNPAQSEHMDQFP